MKLSGAAAGLALLTRAGAARAAAARADAAGVLRIGFVGDARSALALGVQLGVEEARHAAALFGGEVELVASDAGRDSLSDMLEAHDVAALVGGADAQGCASAADACARRRRIYMNVVCADDALRRTHCGRYVFHVAPSERMIADARAEAHASANAAVELWDPALTRFGADTLNERFRARFATAMTSASWAGWFAVKTLWESTLRARSVHPEQLAAYLSRDTTQFDGHKGQPLSFRTWDHQLRQPLYVITTAGSARVVEVPVLRANDNSRAALDRLGASDRDGRCVSRNP